MKTINLKFNDLLKKMMNKAMVIAMGTLLMIGLGSTTAKAGDNGEIKLEVKDDHGDPTMEAVVTLINGTEVIQTKKPDMQNIVFFKEVPAGTYEIKVVLTGKFPQVIKPIVVTANKTTYLDVMLKTDLQMLGTIEIIEPKRNMVQESMTSGTAISFKDVNLSAAPKSDVIAIITGFTPGILPTADGKDIYSRGSRAGSSEYIIDGEKVIGSFNVPSGSIQGMTVFTGGVPAAYGDFTGGLVQITTKSFFNGIQQKRDMYENIQNDLDEQAQFNAEQKKKIEEKKAAEKNVVVPEKK